MKIILLAGFISFFAFSAPSLLNGKEVPREHALRKSTVALVSEINGKRQIFCSGTVIGKKLVITAAHCVEEWYTGKLFIGSGTNPLKGTLFPVSEIKFTLNSSQEEKFGDVAILVFDGPLVGLEPVRLGIPSELSLTTKILQAGYGFNNEEESSTWPYQGKLLMDSSATFFSLNDKYVSLSQKNKSGVMRGDSGGPFYTTEGETLSLHGILATSEVEGNETKANYTHPHFSITWMNCALPLEERIVVPVTGVTNQIPCDGQALIKMQDFSAFTKKLCETRHQGWTTQEDTGCWPANELACLELEREIMEDLRWDDQSHRCLLSE